MAKVTINCSGTVLAAAIIATLAAISILVISYKYCFKENIIPTPEVVNCTWENEKTVQNLTFEAKMAYIRNLSLEANLLQSNKTIEICKTDGCFEAAQELLYTIDGDVDPCEDFFKFACGRHEFEKQESPLPPNGELNVWNKTRLILEILQKENETDLKPVNQARLFYKQCVELDESGGRGLEVLKELITTYGGWPLLEEKWNGSDFNWLEMAGELDSTGIESALISVGIGAELENSTKQAIYLGYGSFGVPERALRKPVKYSDIITAYENFAYNILSEIGYNNSLNQTGLRKSVQEMINFEIKLAQLITFRYDGLYERYKLSELENITGIEWSVYFNKSFSASDIIVDGNEEIYVDDLYYFKKLKTLMDNEKAETIQNHFIWMMVAGLAEYSDGRLRRIGLRFTKAAEGEEEKEVDEMCADLTEETYGFALGAKYLENNAEWINSANKEVERLAKKMKKSFIEIVGEANWIGNETKLKIIGKIEGMRGFIGYPEWLLNGSEVEKYYEGLELGESYIESVIKMMFWGSQKSMMKLRKKTDRNEWSMSVWKNSAQYDQQLNAFLIPFMHNLLPNYGKGRPQHQNYAKVGWTLGHEIMHAFDSTGRLYDEDGNMRNWWDDESKKKYEKKMECIIKQFGQWSWNFPTNMGLNGNMTLGENMADIGGYQISLRAYQNYIKKYGEEKRLPGLESYTPEQLFFIGSANDFCGALTNPQLVHFLLTDTHSPGEIRLRVPFKDSEDFRIAFNCKKEEKNATSHVVQCPLLW